MTGETIIQGAIVVGAYFLWIGWCLYLFWWRNR